MQLLARLLFLFVPLAVKTATSFAAPVCAIRPVNPGCELRTEPVGIDIPNPDFSYTLQATEKNARGLSQSAYQIVVDTSLTLLQKKEGILWNSGKVISDKMAFLTYTGKPLQSSQKYFWKVRVWDQKGVISQWSRVAVFTMGILNEADWKAKWLTAKGTDKFSRTPLGYQAAESDKQHDTKWVQIDLQMEVPFSAIKLSPMFYEDRAGYGFPLQFKVEVSNDAHFTSSTMVADHTAADFPNPRWKPVDLSTGNTTARYIRVTASKLWKHGDKFVFALRQLEVVSNGKNIAAGKPVTAFDSLEKDGWTKKNLTDAPADSKVLPNYSSMLLRRAFTVKPGLLRAVLHVTGLSQYEVFLNGNRTGNHLLSPGWTDYRKTVLYDSYDVTDELVKGSNAIGIMLGNGMYNIQPDTVRYVKFLNSFGPMKAIAQLQLEYADGILQTVSTDKSWQVSPGPVTYSNIFGGEDYDANLEQPGWAKASFKTDARWTMAIETAGPGGTLKGLSSSAPPITAIDTIKPVKITQVKPYIFIYDFGQNASMMPQIEVSGPKGSYVRMIPSELLGKDGFVDRTSATQDGARPAWWQYTLHGNGKEIWFPKFFYQGARYLQVELYASSEDSKLPKVESLQDVIVHSSSARAGSFSCSNELFNRTWSLVRWAQRSNMMSLMTDCPQREKLGWLEENHLNGPSLRYNFDMALLFRKAMNDMADAQLENGLVPNIAPEYFIAGPADLTNGFRNSPEWGSSFIIVPWQQYLFSGDISLLKRYYNNMKRYVAFLAASAESNIIKTGLGDWYDIGPKEPWGSQLTPVSFTATAIYYYDNWIMSRIAKLLGKDQDAQTFQRAANEIRKAFNKEFFKTGTASYATGSQTCNAMPLFLNLVEPQYRTAVLNAVVADIRSHGNGLTSGDVGYRFLLQALAGGGRSDVIFAMNNQSERPGYGYQLKMGATSLTEKWDAGVGSFGSQNHFMLGQINEWFFNGLAGISPGEAGAGFRKIIINPAVTGDLTWVRGAFASISGNIVSEWKKDESNFSLHVTIPANTRAIVYLPAKKKDNVKESGKPASLSAGIKFTGCESDKCSFEIGSGDYHFTSRLF